MTQAFLSELCVATEIIALIIAKATKCEASRWSCGAVPIRRGAVHGCELAACYLDRAVDR